MPHRLLLLLCLLAPPLMAADASEEHDLAYSLGARLGERLRDEVPDLQLEALLDGLRQAYRGQPLSVDSARIEQLLNEHEQRLADSPATVDAASERARRAETRFMVNEKAKAGAVNCPAASCAASCAPAAESNPKPTARCRCAMSGAWQMAACLIKAKRRSGSAWIA